MVLCLFIDNYTAPLRKLMDKFLSEFKKHASTKNILPFHTQQDHRHEANQKRNNGIIKGAKEDVERRV